jgi:cytochrome b pre-mRNA-processing protein 3
MSSGGAGIEVGVRMRRRQRERVGFALYGAAVAAAREPFFYLRLGVPDTLDGRFDMVALHVALLVRRLLSETEPGPSLAQAVFDAMFSDMDVTLRELGVGDLSVGRRVRAMWEGFHGRAKAYGQALGAGDVGSLTAALVRNVWRGADRPGACAAALARLCVAHDAALATQSLEWLAVGNVRFLPAAEASQ